ncbi:MAG: hypothetical protein RL356_160 [Actinomycetota bacterium]
MAIAKYSLTALDCPDPLALANFYAQITDFKVVVPIPPRMESLYGLSW